MRIRVLIGALGLALTVGAAAPRTTSAVAATNGDGTTDPTTVGEGDTRTSEAGEFRRQRDAAIGLAGSARRERAAAALREQIERGGLDPRRALLVDAGVRSERFARGPLDNDARNADVVAPLRDIGAGLFRGAGGGSGDLTPPFALFDGFETYEVDPNPNDAEFGPSLEDQPTPSGYEPWAFSQFWYCAVESSPVGSVQVEDIDNPGSTFDLPLSRNPFNPGGIGGYPLDRDPGVEQIMAIQRGNTDNDGSSPVVTSNFFIGARQSHEPYVPDVDSSETAPGAVIYSMDYYFSDAETFQWHDGESYLEGVINARLFQMGYDFSDSFGPFTEPNGQIQRPIALGTLPGNFTIGQFFATPENPAPGLPTFRTKQREWFSTAVRMSDEDLQMWIRDSSTDGSNGVTIDDARDIEHFESGWAELYPGQQATETSPGVYTGIGRAVNEFGAAAQQPAPLLGGVSHTDIRWVFGGDPVAPNPTVAGWTPTNIWVDNYLVIGPEFGTPPNPKQRTPYKDDIELYDGDAPLALQTNQIWFDAFSSRASVVTNANGTTDNPASDGGAPSQSIRQTNTFIDSIFREEFSTNLPGFNGETEDQRPFATDGSPVDVSALVRLNNTTTGRTLFVDDNDFTSTARALVLGATNASGTADGDVYIRLPNPLFDPNAEIDPSDADEQPELTLGAGKNVPFYNAPTDQNVSGVGVVGDFTEVRLTLFSEGVAEWTIGGAPVTFDTGRLNALDGSGALVQALADADVAGGGDGSPPYSLFPWDARTVDDFEFWSSNNTTGQFGRIFVDDICVDAKILEPGRGPALELPYYDTFSLYRAGASIEGQGDSGFIESDSLIDSNLNIILDEVEIAADSDFGGAADFCIYSVNEVFPGEDRAGDPLPDEFGLSPGEKIYVRKPGVTGFTCPSVEKKPGEANVSLFEDPDVDDGRAPVGLAASLDGEVAGDDGSAAALIATFDRHRPDRLFCRYEIQTPLEALPDPMGGDFDCPNWQVGDVVAIDSIFAEGADTGVAECPGVVGGAADLSIFERNQECEICEGRWLVQDTCMVPDGFGGMEEVPCAAPGADGDIRGYEFQVDILPRWDDAAGGAGNATVVDASTTVDPVTGLAIDSDAVFSEALQMRNNGPVVGSTEDGTVFDDVDALLVELGAEAHEDQPVEVYFDVYVQDTNSRLELIIGGTGGQLTALRFGGPDTQDNVPQDNLGLEITNPKMSGFPPPPPTIWSDTGFTLSTGQWLRFGLRVDDLGQFEVGVDASGMPGGTNGGMMADCFDEYTLIASGEAIDADDGPAGDGLPVNDVTTIGFAQGLDEGGSGAQLFDPTRIEAQTFDAVAMPGAPDSGAPETAGYCFYEINSVLVPSGQAAPQIQEVNPQDGTLNANDGDPLPVRGLSAGDVVAMPFDSTGAFYDNCPNNPNPAGLQFEFVAPSSRGDAIITEGFWTLLGTRNQAGVNDPIPATGISDPDGIQNGQAYNFDAILQNEPARTILIADFISADDTPERAPASQWWFDNLHIKRIGGAEPCPADLANNDGVVGSADLATLLGDWGSAMSDADLDDSGAVGSSDLAILLGSWGPCPTAADCP